jgi:hypothetical protein
MAKERWLKLQLLAQLLAVVMHQCIQRKYLWRCGKICGS